MRIERVVGRIPCAPPSCSAQTLTDTRTHTLQISGCNVSIAKYYRDAAGATMSMNQCPQIDNNDRFNSTLAHIDDYAESGVSRLARPGYYNDLDFLMIGYKMDPLSENPPAPPGQYQTKEEYRTQITIFSVVGAPLIMSADVRGTNENNTITDDMMELLGNTEVIAIDQDPLGQAGERIAAGVWTRRLQGGGVAVALMNRHDEARDVSLESWLAAGIVVPEGATKGGREEGSLGTSSVTVRDVWKQETLTTTAEAGQGWTAKALQPHAVVLLRAEVNVP